MGRVTGTSKLGKHSLLPGAAREETMRKSIFVCLLVLLCLLIYDCASTIPGPKYVARYQRALRLYQEKKYDETLKELKPVLIRFPGWCDGSLLYARAAIATGTIEGRRLASQILARLASYYPERTDIRQELASLYSELGFSEYAETQYKALVKLNKQDSHSHYMLGLIKEKEWKRYHSKRDCARMIAEFGSTVEIDTLNRGGFYHLAVAYLEKGHPDSMQLVLDRMLRSFPSDVDAIMLSAIAHHGKCEYERSQADWNKFFSVCGSATLNIFDDVDLLLTPQQRAKLKNLQKAEKEEFVRRFWKELDPTPATELNERILEHWTRVGISKILFAAEGTGTPGWRTGPGQAIIRYGFPNSVEYAWLPDAQHTVLPKMIWRYVDDYGPFEVVFVDYSLSGEFQYLGLPRRNEPRYTAFLRRAYYAPTHYDHNYAAQVFQILFASAAFLRDSGVQEEFYVGIPLDRVTKGDWRQVPFEAVIFDSLWNVFARVTTTLDGASMYAEGSIDATLIRELSFNLPPGRYIAALTVKDSVSGTLGLTTEDITVPHLSRNSLSISDIELAYLIPEQRVETGSGKDKGLLPNPSGTYVAPSNPRLYYEVYNLAPDRDGRYRFTTKYSIIPHSKGGSTFWGFLVSLFGAKPSYIVNSFGREVESPFSAEQLSIKFSALRDGNYDLVLEVEDSVSKRRVQVEREFEKISASRPSGDASTRKRQ